MYKLKTFLKSKKENIKFKISGHTGKDGTVETSSRLLSQSDSNLRLAGEGSVNIEIRQPGDGYYKNRQPGDSRHPGDSSDILTRVSRTGRLQPSVSVVNLRNSAEQLGPGVPLGTNVLPPPGPSTVYPGGSVDGLHRYGGGVNQRNYFQPQHAKYFQEQHIQKIVPTTVEKCIK